MTSFQLMNGALINGVRLAVLATALLLSVLVVALVLGSLRLRFWDLRRTLAEVNRVTYELRSTLARVPRGDKSGVLRLSREYSARGGIPRLLSAALRQSEASFTLRLSVALDGLERGGVWIASWLMRSQQLSAVLLVVAGLSAATRQGDLAGAPNAAALLQGAFDPTVIALSGALLAGFAGLMIALSVARMKTAAIAAWDEIRAACEELFMRATVTPAPSRQCEPQPRWRSNGERRGGSAVPGILRIIPGAPRASLDVGGPVETGEQYKGSTRLGGGRKDEE